MTLHLDAWVYDAYMHIQGGLFNWTPPKNHKFKKKVEYLDWPPPKSSKCQPVSNCFLRKKLEYLHWPPLKISKCQLQ